MASNTLVIYNVNNPPEFEFIQNTQNGEGILCLGRMYHKKRLGKTSANYVCRTLGCSASISLHAELGQDGKNRIRQPPKIKYLSIDHNSTCPFIHKEDVRLQALINDCKAMVMVDTSKSVQMYTVYEQQVAEFVKGNCRI